jgi:4-carboxymuconolactone decarboxylase
MLQEMVHSGVNHFERDQLEISRERNGKMNDEEIKKRTRETAKKLFSKGIKLDPPYHLWKAFDRDLANDFSKFITGNLYSRTVLSLPERQMVACAMLGALRATDELKLHVNAALNVGCDSKKLAEVFFQLATYAGMPSVNEALAVLEEVLKERGEWPIEE